MPSKSIQVAMFVFIVFIIFAAQIAASDEAPLVQRLSSELVPQFELRISDDVTVPAQAAVRKLGLPATFAPIRKMGAG